MHAPQCLNLEGFAGTRDPTCKMTKMSFSRTMERATDLLEIIHTDVCGLMNVEARGGIVIFSPSQMI